MKHTLQTSLVSIKCSVPAPGARVFAMAAALTSMMMLGCGRFSAIESTVLSANSPASPPTTSVPRNGNVVVPPVPSLPTVGTVPVPIPPTLFTAPTVSAQEMQPIQLQLAADFKVNEASLPTGAFFDGSTQQVRWLSQKGQAGQYKLEFTASGNRTVDVPLNITAQPEANIAKGPLDGLQDGDVGYVFVHGAGDLDRCTNHADLVAYWKDAPAIISRNPALSTLGCYDGRQAANLVAPGIADQILKANCGRFNKCIVITHSMGGLVMEYMFDHARPAHAGDPDPTLFNNAALFQQVRNRTLAVISLASAAGGSRVADIVHQPGGKEFLQTVIGTVAKWVGSDDNATKNMTVEHASHFLAPTSADPGVPFYMVPGYTVKTVGEQDNEAAAIFNEIVGNISLNVYQGDSSLATLDTLVQFDSRPDGLVDFRSSCGIASDNPHDGPGYRASLDSQVNYCFRSTHKPNHYVWFLSNLNHYLISTNWNNCHNSKNPCKILDPDAAHATFSENTSYRYLSAVEAIRAKLDVSRLGVNLVTSSYR